METKRYIMILNKAKVGDSFTITRTTPFGKTVKETLTVEMLFGNRVIFNNGSEALNNL
tara:strand:+ start:270 stop:443 length:174 start_codon:yes stop_codon:yes gene_type:complete